MERQSNEKFDYLSIHFDQLRMLQASYEKSLRFYPYILIYPYTDRIPILSLIPAKL